MRLRQRPSGRSAWSAFRMPKKPWSRGLPIDLLPSMCGPGEAIGRITGENVAEDVIQQVFEEFCVGK